MPLYVASLNSGSNGNCYYIGNEHEAVLIDGGISCRETEKRMRRLALSLKKVKAIFVSHEHGDHIHGVPALAKKHKLPVYITSLTLSNSRSRIQQEFVVPFSAAEAVTIGSLTIKAFPKYHDAADPHSFVVSDGRVNVGVFTDIGRACERVVEHFKQCHAVFLESNYDDDMLASGGYPFALKQRIRNGHGHLSNVEAAKLFSDHASSFMSHLFLSHLSRNNNSPEIAERLFKAIANGTTIVLASRHKETDLYTIDDSFEMATRAFDHVALKRFSTQLSLFQ